jgi:tetratricopeptide (TPR) repeat protein
MAPQTLTMSPTYRAFVRGIHELHRLSVAGRDESPEADSVRDAMDDPWEAMSDVERKRASGLSEDLFSISDPPTSNMLEMNSQSDQILFDVLSAQRRGEWDAALELLRRSDKYLPPALASYIRGSIWEAAGDAETASIFFEHALRLQPGRLAVLSPNAQFPLEPVML